MPKRTGVEETKSVQQIKPASYAAASTTKGAGVNTVGYDDLKVVANVGVITATGVATLKLQESDTDVDGDYADIAGATFGGLVVADDEKVYVGNLNLSKRKPWIRAHLAVATDAAILGCTFELGAAKERPVSQDNDVAFSL